MGFGTGIVPAGWGFSLQNRGHNFSLDARHPNALAPGKRPYHTIIPALATRPDSQSGEELYASFGVMGGFMQPQGHLQVVVAVVDDGLDPQAALDRPRFCIDSVGGRLARRAYPGDGKREIGHRFEMVSGYGRALSAAGDHPATAASYGVVATRADGCAMCFNHRAFLDHGAKNVYALCVAVIERL
jgi:gamma-glutamyltranspeptidase/glutathione hydrolase